ncbi:MAG TPA: 50S ribosomal protein L6 [Peptococcaceae bacterium]|nr:MAG: 50S ribosomal protein L6 [Clostridia bacterium 41_269]HBT20956.1 50S ribosomal protein L6 [Peptococcaceae bacterium]
MSRVGKAPIKLASGVEVKVDDDNTVTVKGPKGTLTQKMPREMKIIVENSVVRVERPTDQKNHKALHGLTRALINNMVIGVTEGFQKALEVVGVGYRAQLKGKKLVLMVGYSQPVELDIPEGIEVEVPDNNNIIIKGIDKQQVGEFAARVRKVRPPEPYKGKGIRYKNEVVRRKEGKAGVAKG